MRHARGQSLTPAADARRSTDFGPSTHRWSTANHSRASTVKAEPPPSADLTRMPRFAIALRLAALMLALGARALMGQAPAPRFSPQQAQEDFDVLWRALAEAHGGYTRFVTASDVDQRFAAHRSLLQRPVTSLELAGILSEAIAELRDGHARLELDSAIVAALATAKLLPLRVALEQDRLVVRLNDSPTDRSIAPGMEIISINGRSTKQIIDALLPKISGDGLIETGRRYRLAQELARLYWLYVEQASTYTVVARNAADQRVTAQMAGVTDLERRTSTNPVNATIVQNAARLDGPPGRVTLEFLDDGAVARLRVRAFDGQTFVATLDSAFRLLSERGTPSLLLDLRGNGGGVDEYGAKLVSYFTARPFRYFDRIHVTTIAPSFATWLPRTFEAMRSGTVPDRTGGYLVTPERHPGVGEQPPSAPGFAGRLAVLIDGGSFSTTADASAHLRSWNRAVFIGEETAGTYEGNTSGLNALIVLPHSRLRLRVMMYGYWNAVTPVPGGRGVMADHVVPLRVADVLAGRDPAVDLGRALLRRQ